MIEKFKNYFILMRFHKPIGILLLLWPTWWSLWLANQGHPPMKRVLLFTLGVIVMRAAGCVVNDFADRHFDGNVQRTQHRPLATGVISSTEALVIFTILTFIALIIVCQLNILTIGLSVIALMVAILYPFTKRFFPAPQLFLGGAFSFGILMAYSDSINTLPWQAAWLFVANIFWIMAYDTSYALVDREDDQKIGIYSTAILFKQYDVSFIIIFQILFLLSMFLFGYLNALNFFYFIGMMLASAISYYLFTLLLKREYVQYFRAFMMQQWVGLVIFFGVFLDGQRF